jgi:hypothetical protein
MRLMLIPCVDTVYSGISFKCSWLFTVKFINENMYSHGRVKISNLLNILLHVPLGLPSAINLAIFFCKVNQFFS